MENPIVIGILDIVEDKLREFGIQIPDDDREDSQDPIVGYHYAELHDRIVEYLKAKNVLRDVEVTKLYGISIVNSDGFLNGRESVVKVHRSHGTAMFYAFCKYCEITEENSESYKKLSQKKFESLLKKDKVVHAVNDCNPITTNIGVKPRFVS